MRGLPRGPGWLASLALVTGLAGEGTSFAQEAPAARAYVLDSGTRSIAALELPTGKRVATLSIEGSPEAMLRSPDGRRLVVLDRGPGEDKGDRGYKAKGKASATVVDPATMAVVARTELGWGLEAPRWYFSPDGSRLTVLCPGYEAKNPAESLIRELVTLDLATGGEARRLTLEHGTVPILPTKDGRSLLAIQGLPREAKFPFPQSRLWFVDLEGPSTPAKLDMGGWTYLYTDGVHFHLLDAGKPDKNPQKNRNGTLQIASVERRALEDTVDAGRGPRGLVQDEQGGQVFILSDGPPVGESAKAESELRVVRGATLAATLKVAANPRWIQRHGDVLYVVGGRAVTLVDPANLQVTATIPLEKGGSALVGDDDTPTALATSPDGKRGFVLYGPIGPFSNVTDRLVVLDLEQRRAVGAVKTGRGGKKFLQAMKRGLANMPGGGMGALMFGYPENVASPWSLAVRPDGRFAYALNMNTKDVTIVDSSTAEAVEKIGAGGYRLELLKGGGVLAVVSGSELHLLDTATNKKTAELELKGLRGLFLSPDGAYAVAPADRTVLCLDGATGKVLARLTDFVKPEVVVFDPPPGQVRP